MERLAKLREAMVQNPNGVAFADLAKLRERYFGKPRQSVSHLIFNTLWPGAPRVNIHDDGMARSYRARKILAAIERIEHG